MILLSKVLRQFGYVKAEVAKKAIANEREIKEQLFDENSALRFAVDNLNIKVLEQEHEIRVLRDRLKQSGNTALNATCDKYALEETVKGLEKSLELARKIMTKFDKEVK